ncbi:hypothetical protein C4D60_Mb06t14410 [Musa balbisiana]|uniref:Dipeptidylpeptidase IV N-terminal domain-containing protein n=1 Tax=Musa balbisiana TaxID=52838 RepID=A0A4S8INQ9_MUSBA|nr:hypothetical protein C4D60_Mb06t14410 [Musa balbisiana]
MGTKFIVLGMFCSMKSMWKTVMDNSRRRLRKAPEVTAVRLPPPPDTIAPVQSDPPSPAGVALRCSPPSVGQYWRVPKGSGRPAAARDGDKEAFAKKPRRWHAEMLLADANDDFFLFPVEEIVQYPLPGYVAPSSISFSPDGRLSSYYFSPDGTLHRKVFSFDVASRWGELVFSPPDGGGLDESILSAEEKLRRERALGVTRYEWRARSPSSSCFPPGKPAIMVPLPAGVYFQEVCGSEPELKLPSCPGSPITDPHLSPDGSMLASVKDDELHVLSLSQGKPKQLTFGARTSGKRNGLVGSDAQEDHAYPSAGAANVKVRLGVVPVAGGEVTWMDLIVEQTMNSVLDRYHSKLKILNFDIQNGQKEVLYLEEQELGPLTQGNWMVEQISGVNENAGLLHLTVTVDGPLESNFYCMKLFPDWNLTLQPPKRLTYGRGRHAGTFDYHMQTFVDVHDSLNSLPRVLLCSLHDGSIITPLYEQPLTIPRFGKLQLTRDCANICKRWYTFIWGSIQA